MTDAPIVFVPGLLPEMDRRLPRPLLTPERPWYMLPGPCGGWIDGRETLELRSNAVFRSDRLSNQSWKDR